MYKGIALYCFASTEVAYGCTILIGSAFDRDNGKENENYYSILGFILGLFRDNEKENGNYYSILGLYRV